MNTITNHVSGFGHRVLLFIVFLLLALPVENGLCRLSLVFTDHYNPDWEDVPMYFTTDPEQSFEETGKEVIEDCISGDIEKHNCEGPMLELVN